MLKGMDTMMKTIRVGSRDSQLAVIQSQIVIKAIKDYDPTINVELITMKTTGDKILNQPLDKIGGKGLFVKELDAALIDGRVDITVHSSKDLPMEIDYKIPIVAISDREDPRDVLVLPENCDTHNPNRPIGCSSARRTIQLKNIYPQVEIKPVRGNIQTRLKKLEKGEFSALVLAAAGLRRLGLEDRISRIFTKDEMLPAAGQGILAVQARREEDISFLAKFHHEDTSLCLKAERAFVRALDGGCSLPVAAHAVIDGENIYITGLFVKADGVSFITSTISGDKNQAETLGITLAERMRNS